MEDLKAQEKILKLGKTIVKELGLEPGVDTLGRWMAHYISEKMTKAEDSEEAKKECFETILKVWEHRWLLSRGNRPLENFEPILKVLEKISPDHKSNYYSPYQDAKIEKCENKEIESCVNSILQIDMVARIWIEFFLTKATEYAKNETEQAYLDICKDKTESVDIDVIKGLFEDFDPVKNLEKERLEKRIEELEKYSKLNEIILESYKDELHALD